MDEHHIHDEKIGFHSDTSAAKDYLKHDLSREGMKKLLGKAEGGRSVEFRDHDGNKFKLSHDEEKGFHVERHY